MPQGMWNAILKDFGDVTKIPAQLCDLNNTTAGQIADSTQAVFGSVLTVGGTWATVKGFTKLAKAGVALAKKAKVQFVTGENWRKLKGEEGYIRISNPAGTGEVINGVKVLKIEGNVLYMEDGTKLYRNLRPEDAPEPIRLQQFKKVGGKYKDALRGWTVDSGSYQFIITKEGKILEGKGGHIDLSKGTEVKYAGEITFNGKAQLTSWSNRSGHYKPIASDAKEFITILQKSGLDDISMDNFIAF